MVFMRSKSHRAPYAKSKQQACVANLLRGTYHFGTSSDATP